VATVEPDPAARLQRLVSAMAPPVASALRLAGLDRQGAEVRLALHRELERTRFGPDGPGEVAPDLQREIGSALTRLPKLLRRAAGIAAAGILVAGHGAAASAAQESRDGVALYAEGAYGPAAVAFRAGTLVATASSADFYDLAAAEYMLRRDAHAAAALLIARERAPRDPRVGALWNTLAREHDQLRHLGGGWPMSAEEALVGALILLWVAAILYALFPARRTWWGVVAGVALAVCLTGVALRAQRTVPRAVLTGGASLRVSPHGLAPELGSAPAFSLVRLVRSAPGWWLVETAAGGAGWIVDDVLAPLPTLN
ncbi:MAG: hypothetical protein HOP28_09260, partial [Gemmatimonadales bacterium]|nr:hypothetical protein [Gemmatimonadales bacterium]